MQTFRLGLLLLALCAVGAVSMAAAPDVPATPPSPSYADVPEMRALLHWEHFPLHIFFPAGRLASPERKGLVLAGFDEWVRATHGIVCYQVVLTGSQADLSITFTPHLPAAGSSHVGGQTTLTRTGTVLKKAAMEIAERDEDRAGFQAVCAHEFGHALGIDGHSDDPDDIMFPVMSFSRPLVRNDEIDPPDPARSVTRRDLGTLQAAYPDTVFAPPKH